MNGTPAATTPVALPALQGQARVPATPNRPSPLQNTQLLQRTSKRLSRIKFYLTSFSIIATPQQLPPPRKQWFDKVADALLGEDTDPSNSKFALICENCFNHNGLVKETEFDDMSA